MSDAQATTFLRPAILAGVIGALSGIVAALVIAALVWVGAPQVSPLGALKAGFFGWVYAHGAGLTTGSVSLGLIPLGAPAVIACLVWNAAVRTPHEGAPTVGFVGVLTGTYTAIVAVAALAASTGGLSLGVGRAVLGAALISSGVGLAATRDDWWWRINAEVRALVGAALHGVAWVMGLALILLMTMLVVHREMFVELWAALGAGAIGGVGVFLLCIALLPNLALWAVAVMVGPGFSLGERTLVDLGGAQLGPVPAVPVFAALPPPGAFPGWVFALAIVPILGGVVAGWRVSVRVDRPRLRDGAALGAVAGLLGGVMLTLAMLVSGGSLGPQLMSVSGPVVWPTIVLAPLLPCVGGALGAVAGHYRGARADA